MKSLKIVDDVEPKDEFIESLEIALAFARDRNSELTVKLLRMALLNEAQLANRDTVKVRWHSA